MPEDSREPGSFLRLLPRFLRIRIENRHELRKALANVSWLSTQTGVEVVVGLLVGIWVARYLGPQQYGALSYAVAFASLFTSIATLGFGIPIVRDLVAEPETVGDLLGTITLLRGAGGLLMIAVSFGAIMALRPGETTVWNSVLLISVGLGIRYLATVEFWFQSRVQGKYIMFSRTTAVVTSGAIKLALILVGAGFMLFVAAYALEGVLVSVCMFTWYVLTTGNSLRGWRFRRDVARKTLGESWPLIFMGFLWLAFMKVDQVMLGEMRGDRDVGIYAVAARISEAFHVIPNLIFTSVFPALIRARSIGRELYLGRMQRLYDSFIWFALTAALVMQFASGPIIALLFGSAYVEAATVLAVHIWSGVFWFAGAAGHRFLIAEGKAPLTLVMTAIGTLANVALNLSLIPAYGAIGAAWSTLVSFAVTHWLTGVLFNDSRITFLFFLRSLWLPGLVRRWVDVLRQR